MEGPPITFGTRTGQFNISYVLDIFGGTRRQIEVLKAQAEYQRFQLEAAYLTLTANVASAAVTEAALREQIAATKEIIKIENEGLELMRRQFELGGSSKAAMLQQEATLAQERATLPGLEKQLAQQRNLLANYSGRFPGEELGARFQLAAFALPRQLPVSLPSKLVAPRPDVRAAEAQLHASSAQIGVTTANQLPQLTLTASYGGVALGALSGSGVDIWTAGANAAQTLFDAGALRHKKRAAVAAYDQATAQYRSTVLSALQDVANALSALQYDAKVLQAQSAAERAAAGSLALTRQQFRDGAADYLSLLTVQQTYQEARIDLIQAQAARLLDTVVLFRALGGGWWNRADVPPDNGAPRGATGVLVP